MPYEDDGNQREEKGVDEAVQGEGEGWRGIIYLGLSLPDPRFHASCPIFTLHHTHAHTTPHLRHVQVVRRHRV